MTGKPNATQIYGEWAVGPHPALHEITAGHVLGGRLRNGGDGEPSRLAIQWRDLDGQVVQLEMQFVQALFLLSVLKSAQLDTGLPFPDDPRAPSARS